MCSTVFMLLSRSPAAPWYEPCHENPCICARQILSLVEHSEIDHEDLVAARRLLHRLHTRQHYESVPNSAAGVLCIWSKWIDGSQHAAKVFKACAFMSWMLLLYMLIRSCLLAMQFLSRGYSTAQHCTAQTNSYTRT